MTLSCNASGHPKPHIVWRRENGDDIMLSNGKKGTHLLINSSYELLHTLQKYLANFIKRKGPSTYYVTSMGGRGVCKMMSYDDRGRGGYEMMTSSIKEAFWSSTQKRSLKVNFSFFNKKNSTSFLLLTKIFFSFFFVNVFQTFYLSKINFHVKNLYAERGGGVSKR